jgi:hypothetical protein
MRLLRCWSDGEGMTHTPAKTGAAKRAGGSAYGPQSSNIKLGTNVTGFKYFSIHIIFLMTVLFLLHSAYRFLGHFSRNGALPIDWRFRLRGPPTLHSTPPANSL